MARSDDFLQAAFPDEERALLACLDALERSQGIPRELYFRVRQWFGRDLLDMLDGNKTVDEALLAAQRNGRAQMPR